MRMDSLRLAKVAAVHPAKQAVDLVFLEDGSQIAMVQCMVPEASTNTGLAGLPVPSLPPSGDKFDLTDSKDRDILAVVGFLHGLPVVLGFLHQQVTQMLFEAENRAINRHASDVYTLMEGNGDVELSHPSGTYLRIAQNPAHQDLTATDYNKLWKIDKNTDTAVHVHLEVANAGTKVASLDIDPDGNITLEHDGNLVTNTGGNATVDVAGTLDATVQGDVTVTTPATVTVDAPTTTFTGEVIIQGAVTYQAGMSGTGGATITGDVDVTGDVTADGISLKTHTHSDPQGGNTGPPNP